MIRLVSNANVRQFFVSQPSLYVYGQGSLLVGLVGSNVETKFNNLEVSTSDLSKESPLQLLIFTWPGPNVTGA
jgi:hypothetical protein